MHPSQNIQHFIVESELDFDTSVNENGMVVDVASKDSEKRYERLDTLLATQIQELMMVEFGKDKDGILYHQNWDWWPTCTRFLYIDPAIVRWETIDKLRSLLVDELMTWRFNIHIIGDMASSAPKEIGGINIYRDWLLLQRSSYNLLTETATSS